MIVICVFFSLTLYASREKAYKNKSSDFPSCCGLIQVQNTWERALDERGFTHLVKNKRLSVAMNEEEPQNTASLFSAPASFNVCILKNSISM